MSQRTFGRTVSITVVLLLAGAALLATPRSASSSFHLRLLRSDPAADTTLTTAPAAIRLWFSEPPQVAVTTVLLTNSAGTTVATGKPTRAAAKDAPVSAPVQGTLTPGAYHVAWKTMSADGHAVRGEFSFTLKAAPTQPAR
jgi:methionine-rich copper-binding protein CopC